MKVQHCSKVSWQSLRLDECVSRVKTVEFWSVRIEDQEWETQISAKKKKASIDMQYSIHCACGCPLQAGSQCLSMVSWVATRIHLEYFIENRTSRVETFQGRQLEFWIPCLCQQYKRRISFQRSFCLYNLSWVRKNHVFNINFRYHQFKGAWQANKAPGEKSHKNLRWNVRVRIINYLFWVSPATLEEGIFIHCCAVCSSHQSLCKQFWVHFFN